MRIGILTFHWVTNYGAVLQTFALQTYLESRGHEVSVINYKPKNYDDTLWTFIRYRKFVHLSAYYHSIKQENALSDFRQKKLHLTERVYQCSEIEYIAKDFDIIISGSDQVLNPWFLQHGEGKNHITPTYFLGFPFNGKRVGYALSFGCTEYPDKAKQVSRSFLSKFDLVSVRENTGIDIAKSMGRSDAVVVPDPTLLLDSSVYQSLAAESLLRQTQTYTYCFFIRNVAERKKTFSMLLQNKSVLWNNEDGHYRMQDWLSKINNAELVITDSFHCVVMCLKLHTPFIVITELYGNVGMNDRLYTLLAPLQLADRVVHKNNMSVIDNLINQNINWIYVENVLTSTQEQGKQFFQCML